ncbi:mycofactocin-coupled SDR family oxidoreductase [Nocardioides sp. Bht2]|uniref:mycofactocin-coupled SDR family oxidoreductase n=1 Tax=Nocardioides sp. Bht2 TaxID=3392297 RepID=UPI0039B52FDB
MNTQTPPPQQFPDEQRLAGKVAFITGAARGVGRSLATTLAANGADIIAMDLCADAAPNGLTPAPEDTDLATTVRLVEEHGGRAIAIRGDVRDRQEMTAALDNAVAALGRLDIVCVNAGLFKVGPSLEISDADWQAIIDVNLTGAWNTCRAALPHLIAAGGGSIVITRSTAGLRAAPGAVHYSASKHAVVGLTKTLAKEFGPRGVRCNSVHPTAINTPMIQNEEAWRAFAGSATATKEEAARARATRNPLGVDAVEPEDVANAVLWLSSDEARFVTGATIPVDAGMLVM